MTTLVDNPACQCCPHIRMSDLERDQMARKFWDNCPDSGCLRELCETCQRRLPDLKPVRVTKSC